MFLKLIERNNGIVRILMIKLLMVRWRMNWFIIDCSFFVCNIIVIIKLLLRNFIMVVMLRYIMILILNFLLWILMFLFFCLLFVILFELVIFWEWWLLKVLFCFFWVYVYLFDDWVNVYILCVVFYLIGEIWECFIF